MPNVAEVHLYFGQPGTGKTTAAKKAYEASDPAKAVLIDGDICRKMWPGLGYTPDDRKLQQNRLADLAVYFHAKGLDVFVSTVCPTIGSRLDWKSKFRPEDLHFHYMQKVYDEEKYAKYKCDFFDIPNMKPHSQ